MKIAYGRVDLVAISSGQHQGRAHGDRVRVLRVLLQDRGHEIVRVSAPAGGGEQLYQTFLEDRLVLGQGFDRRLILLLGAIEFTQPEEEEIAREQTAIGKLLLIGHPLDHRVHLRAALEQVIVTRQLQQITGLFGIVLYLELEELLGFVQLILPGILQV